MAYEKAIAKYRGAVGLELRLRGWTYTQIAEAVGYFDKPGLLYEGTALHTEAPWKAETRPSPTETRKVDGSPRPRCFW